MSTKKTKTEYFQVTPTCHTPITAPQYEAANRAFAEILTDKTNTIFIACSAGLRQYRLERTYDAAFVINEAYLRMCSAITAGKTISNYPGWIRLTCRHVIQELSRETQKKNKLNQQLYPETVPASDTNDWLDNEDATPEQLRMRQAFAQLSALEQDILQLKVVRNLRWDEVQEALMAAGHPMMTPNCLSQKKRRALKKLKKSYKAIAG